MAKKIPAALSAYIPSIGSKGGKASGKSLTAEQRKARARKAAAARWKNAT
jgi:hypothetical protein